jgi:bifunctional DNA-binding transcriptional regulator/antitoxin component of YhaV-PrlF toxin-antitoxin module
MIVLTTLLDHMPRRSRRSRSAGTSIRSAGLRHLCHTASMKATLSVSRRGVVTLPAKLRQALGIKADDQLIAETTAEGLLLHPAITPPIETYSAERIRIRRSRRRTREGLAPEEEATICPPMTVDVHPARCQRSCA